MLTGCYLKKERVYCDSLAILILIIFNHNFTNLQTVTIRIIPSYVQCIIYQVLTILNLRIPISY